MKSMNVFTASRPAAVHSAKPTCATSVGRTQCVSAGRDLIGSSKGAAAV